MPKPNPLLLLTDTGWTIACVRGQSIDAQSFDAADPLSPEALDELTRRIEALGARGRPAVLGLPSSRVYADTVATDGLPKRGRHAGLLYRLEENLPLDAERLTAGFVPTTADAAFGVAVDTERTRTVIDALDARAIEIAHLRPTALLVLAEVLHRRYKAGAPHAAVIALDDAIEIVRLEGDAPAGWSTASAFDPEEVVRAVEADLLIHPREESPVAILAIGDVPAPVAQALSGIDRVEIEPDDTPAIEHAARAADRLLCGRETGWVELRRDGLAPADLRRRLRPWLRAAAVLALALAASAAGGLYWRSRQLAIAAEAVEREQEAVYRTLYTTGPLPVDIASRLRSEVRRLAGVRGMGVEVPQRVCALEALRRMTSELPPGLRLRITGVQIHAGTIYIEGQARSHSDAETVAQALKRAGLDLERPRTERLATDGVAFTLSGRISAVEPAAGIAADDRTEDTP